MGLKSNLLHLCGALIICFYLKYKGAPALVRDAFNENRRLHSHVFVCNFRAVEQSNVGHRPSHHVNIRQVCRHRVVACRRATSATEAPANRLSAAIRARSAFVRSRRPVGPSITSSRENTPPDELS